MGLPAAATTATLTCTFGAAPSTLVGTSAPTVLIEGKPAATVGDTAPIVNVASFGMCFSLGNPSVAAATSAAFGTLTPMPCVPALTRWVSLAPRTRIGGMEALTTGTVCPCSYGGLVQIANPGTLRTQVG